MTASVWASPEGWQVSVPSLAFGVRGQGRVTGGVMAVEVAGVVGVLVVVGDGVVRGCEVGGGGRC